MNYLKYDNTVMKNKNDNYEFNEFGIEPCELEDFEVNPDADDSIVDISEEEYDEVMREQERKQRINDRILALLRILLNFVISLLVIGIVWYFCK